MIKRYMVFRYHDYYPLGGMTDFVGATDSREAVIELATDGSYQNTDIFDTKTERTYVSLDEFLKEE